MRSTANSAKVEVLGAQDAQIREIRPGAAAPSDTVISATRDAGGPGALDSDAEGASGGGAEHQDARVLAFPEPPVRRRRRYALAGTGIAAALLAVLFFVVFFSPALVLKNLRVEGNTLMTTPEAEAALAPLLGTPLALVSDSDAGALLADRPEVESVKVTAVPPSDLVVTVTERVPVAVLQNGSEFLLIDEEGRQLKSVGERGQAALPLIDGGTEAVNSSVFPTVTAVLAALPPNVLGMLDHASAQTVDSVELKLTGGQTVFWGSAEANAAKARALEALLLMPPADPPVSVFDVSTPNRPVTR
ncbi:FtsQ-type POTRA domain-containing protein [Arthrobacter gandavensis]|uniref:cell division protein FtsQ/DivIB n=1 Tax=Arthrobacter gandavensis TaxID=169960 RepID=UPI00188F67EE|nr:FtsQ-type POTRA domain-containing protein [Arthrobacter gandavensis]MBF4994860.1 FtsQ-type POTRA domain-containing protein [Arthrobacter gandavensis]